jgi:hypothetical protein
MVDQLWARPDSPRTITDRPALQRTVRHLTSDSPESHGACHKPRRQSPARPDGPDTIPDHLVPLRTVRSPRSDCPGVPTWTRTLRVRHNLHAPTTPAAHHSRSMPSPVHEAECLTAPAKPEKYRSLSLFGLLRPNLLLALLCIQHKKGKLSSHLMFLSVIKYLMNYLRIATLNCRTQFLR